MTPRHIVLVAVAAMASATACRPRTGALAAAPTGASCASGTGVGRLVLAIAAQPAPGGTSETLVRLESETERSTVRVNTALGTTFELRPGRYRLSLVLGGYNSAERQVQIACGTEQTLTVPLEKKR